MALYIVTADSTNRNGHRAFNNKIFNLLYLCNTNSPRHQEPKYLSTSKTSLLIALLPSLDAMCDARMGDYVTV